MEPNRPLSHETNITTGDAEGDYFTFDNSSSARVDGEEVLVLPSNFLPGKWDVICQRGKECFDHAGNRQFRIAIDSHLDTYMEVKNRQQKSRIVTMIVDGIKRSAGKDGGGFVRKDLLTRRWFRVSDKLAREKVGQALRDAIKTRRASVKKASSVKKGIPSTSRLLFDSVTGDQQRQLQPQHYSNSNLPDTATSSYHSASQSPALQQQQIINFVPASMSHPSDPMPFINRSLLSDLEPRPISLPVLSSGGYDDCQGAASAELTANRVHQQSQNKTTSLPTAATMTANMLEQSSVTNTTSRLFLPSRICALPQNQQFPTSTAFPSSGFSQLRNGNSATRDVPGSAAHTTSEYSYSSVEQQQMLSSIIGQSRSDSGSCVPLANSYTLEDDMYTNAVIANSWLDASSTMNPTDISSATSFLFHKHEQSTQQQRNLGGESLEASKSNSQR